MATLINLTAWQKKQAALIYYFSSLSYLESVKLKVQSLLTFSTDALSQAAAENRDANLTGRRWGTRDTAENWGNNAWSTLADFQQNLAKDIALRASNTYNVTSRNHCARALAEYSMEWTTPQEQATFDSKLSDAFKEAQNIDITMNKLSPHNSWNDFSLAQEWNSRLASFSRIPKFLVREDLCAETNATPPITGVYVSSDDPHATLQFAWNGGEGGKLLEGIGLNGLGLSAQAEVGREKLWIDGRAMLGFVENNLNNQLLRADSFFDMSQNEELASSLVARQAFITRPSKWYFVQIIENEFDDCSMLTDEHTVKLSKSIRSEAGTECAVAGFYFTPARIASRRYFKIGDLFPNVSSEYGAVIWQYDEDQD